MKQFVDYFHLDKLKPFEFIYAMYPILSAYQYGSIPFGLLILLILDYWAIRKGAEPAQIKLLSILTIYIIGHEIIVLLINDLNQTHINSIISRTIFMLSIFIILPALNYERAAGAIYLVGIICSIGLIYHVLQILSGNTVSPIAIPFLPDLPPDSRVHELSIRPKSFFWEPGGYATFMMLPLLISLLEKKILLASYFFFTMVLSTSTNGIVQGSLLIFLFILMNKIQLRYKLVISVLMGVMVYVFLTSPIFEFGLNKIENTDTETNIRLSTGPSIVENMPAEHIFWGIPVHGIEEYYVQGYTKNFSAVPDDIFVPSFWSIIIDYGIPGLVLNFSLYLLVIFKCRQLSPYVIVLLISQFVQYVSFNSMYVFQFLFMFSYLVYDRDIKIRYKRNLQMTK